MNEVQTARQRLDRLLEATQEIGRIGGWDIDIVSGDVFWTSGVYHLLEIAPQEYTPTRQSTRQFFTPETLTVIEASFQDVINQPETHDYEIEMITAKGRHIWVHSLGHTTWEAGRPIRRTATVQDITERRQARQALREAENRWKLALESAGDGVWDWNVATGEQFFSPRLLEMYGFHEGEIDTNSDAVDALVHPDDLDLMRQDLQAHFDQRTPSYQNEHRVQCKDGSWKWVLSRGMVISRDADGKPLRMIGTHTDISARKKSEELIWQQAHFDVLTGLPNRRMLRARLEQDIEKCKRNNQQLACLFIDLDHFKEVNDTLGHDVGDKLLVDVARRIKDSVRACDTVARMGGDEFIVVLSELNATSDTERILQKLLDVLSSVFQLGLEKVFVSASIGVTIYPFDADNVEDLFKNADQALYVAKGGGRNRFSFFTPALQEAVQRRLRLTSDMHAAVALQQFYLVFQPIVDLASGAVRKAEALIRWQHPQRGLINPADFIAVAEANGLIIDIGEWVLQRALEQVQKWRATLDANFQISVNKSPVQFQSATGHRSWLERLQAMDLPGEALVVEITEGLLLDSNANVASKLLDLSAAGIKVSLDDFGTGYSSLAYLQKFDIDFLKIDQSFVRHLSSSRTDLALCKAIIAMSHELGLQVIAEGIETPAQRDLLLAAGCDYGQGYLFSRPLAADQFEAFWQQRGVSCDFQI